MSLKVVCVVCGNKVLKIKTERVSGSFVCRDCIKVFKEKEFRETFPELFDENYDEDDNYIGPALDPPAPTAQQGARDRSSHASEGEQAPLLDRA